MSNKYIIIYHGNCADGFSAAWCFWHWNKEFQPQNQEVIYHAGTYGKAPPDCTDAYVYLVDFSYKRAIVQEILKQAKMVTLIDHHITAIEDLKPLVDFDSPEWDPKFAMVASTEFSGARLVWDFLYNHNYHSNLEHNHYRNPPLLLSYVEDRDLWRFKLDGSKDVSQGLFSHKYDFETWEKLMMNEGHTISLRADGNAIERKHLKDIEELLAVCKHMDWIGGEYVPVANLPYTMASDAAGIMAKEFENGEKFAATFYMTGNETIYSLRSAPNGMDVSKIAEQYGGGGHKHAAGFKLSHDDKGE